MTAVERFSSGERSTSAPLSGNEEPSSSPSWFSGKGFVQAVERIGRGLLKLVRGAGSGRADSPLVSNLTSVDRDSVDRDVFHPTAAEFAELHGGKEFVRKSGGNATRA